MVLVCCLLVALDEIYQPVYAPIPRSVTLRASTGPRPLSPTPETLTRNGESQHKESRAPPWYRVGKLMDFEKES